MNDSVVDVCKCGHLHIYHYDFGETWDSNFENKGCIECNCLKKDFDYTTTIIEYAKSILK